jgi:hypothetical protein
MSLVTNCIIDNERLATIKECMNTVGMDYMAPDSEWPWNVVSKRATVFSCGMMARQGEKVEHNHDLAELEMCKALANRGTTVMAGTEIGMGSEGSKATSQLEPFFVAANIGTKCLKAINEDVIRAAFGGTIYPPTKIWIEPLKESGEWWSQVLTYFDCYEGEEKQNYLRPWRNMMSWFSRQKDFIDTSFVMIGEDPLGGENGGCVFPRLAIGLTRAGSLAGIIGCVVHT